MARLRLRALVGALVAFAAVAAACADEGGPTTSPTGTVPTTTEPTTTAPPVSTLEEGVLQVASCLDYPPFESVEGGDEVGFDVEMAEEIASRLGLEVRWITHDFDTVFTALDGNQFDMVAAASTITKDRDKIVDFSDPYFAARQSFVVNVEETPDLTSTDQLEAGDVVGVQKGTTGEIWAKENLASQGIELKAFTNITPAYQDLEAGNILGIVTDEPQAASVAGSLYPSLAVVQGIDTDEDYGFAFSEDNPELRDAVNVVLAEMIADGTYAAIFQKWFPGQEIPPQFQPTA
jgi:polar amino acid transport system substrate-binding protein